MEEFTIKRRQGKAIVGRTFYGDNWIDVAMLIPCKGLSDQDLIRLFWRQLWTNR